MIDMQKINRLRMDRMHLTRKADEAEYLELYRDLQPGLNVYWNGFGEPPTLSFRADFDDIELNRQRQLDRRLIKGRFVGGNLGWIIPEDLELFAGLYRKPLTGPNEKQLYVLDMIERCGPVTIQDIKSESGMLVKELTPVLHRLQEAFLVYEDQYNGQWDRGWYRFGEIFPEADVERYSRAQALDIVIPRFARRMVWVDKAMLRSFYRLTLKELAVALERLAGAGVLMPLEGGYILAGDAAVLEALEPGPMSFVYAIHRNDPLYRALEPELKDAAAQHADGLEYDHEPLQYLLIDGEFSGVVVGHFRNGPYDLNDVVCYTPEAAARREEIIQAVKDVNFGNGPVRFMGEKL